MYVKKVFYFAIIIILLIIINNLAQSLYGVWQKKDLIVQTKARLDKEKKENEELKKKVGNASRPGFVEEEARNKLFLVRPGEEVVLIPSGALGKTPPKPATQDTRPNWRKWWEVFFTTAP